MPHKRKAGQCVHTGQPVDERAPPAIPAQWDGGAVAGERHELTRERRAPLAHVERERLAALLKTERTLT